VPQRDRLSPPGASRLSPEHDLSHLEGNLPRASVGCVLRHWGASMALYTPLLGLLFFNSWFRGLLQISVGGVWAWQVYLGLYAAYAGLAPVVFLIFRPRSLWNSKNVMIVGWLGRIVRHVRRHGFAAGDGSWRPGFKEKHAGCFLLIKLIYGPLMLSSGFVAMNGLAPFLVQWSQAPNGLTKLDAAYGVLVAAVFLLDSVLFFVGYHTEAACLGNEVRYVETSLSGLVVCLACYSPFNVVTTTFLGPSNDETQILFRGDLHHPLTWVLRGLAVGSLVLLTSASFSLFTKASNLTNRGIVERGPYRWIRHPGYVGKNLFWLFTLLPLFVAVDFSNPAFPWKEHVVFCLVRIGGFVGWCTVYVLRALTEERLLRQDPDYVAYCEKVRYRFIPGLW
jgi:protein-S-isoprenylcysteine O-methyltransferase Ste14